VEALVKKGRGRGEESKESKALDEGREGGRKGLGLKWQLMRISTARGEVRKSKCWETHNRRFRGCKTRERSSKHKSRGPGRGRVCKHKSRGPGRHIHCGVEVTKLSTNKQLSLSHPDTLSHHPDQCSISSSIGGFERLLSVNRMCSLCIDIESVLGKQCFHHPDQRPGSSWFRRTTAPPTHPEAMTLRHQPWSAFSHSLWLTWMLDSLWT
jgi:hypothetical protein